MQHDSPSYIDEGEYLVEAKLESLLLGTQATDSGVNIDNHCFEQNYELYEHLLWYLKNLNR